MDSPRRVYGLVLLLLSLQSAVLVPSLASAQAVDLTPDSQFIQHAAGTFFTLQLQTNIPAALNFTSVLADGTSGAYLFEITSTSLLKSTIELQQLIGGAPALTVTVTATAHSGGTVDTAVYSILIQANTTGIPFFLNETATGGYVANVLENTPIGSEVKEIVARVPSGASVQLLSFDPPSTVFLFAGQKIIVLNALDRESTDFYNLTIQAQNGVEFKRTQILITVLDVNDNAPTIMAGQTGCLYAHDPQGSYVMTIVATDSDFGSNSRLDFSIVAGANMAAFRIDTSGMLYLTQAAVLLPSNLTLSIRVGDNGIPSFTSIGSVTIGVVANNSAPEFLMPFYVVAVFENTPVPHVLLTVNATDPDPNEAGSVVYSLTAVPMRNSKPIFVIGTTSGEVSLVEIVDFEDREAYQFNVTATDQHCRKPLFAMTTIDITIKDSNDNPPVVLLTSLIFQLEEDTALDHEVFDVSNTVTDRDSGVNKVIMFYFYPPIDSSFRMDPVTGKILVNKTLSSQTQARHILNIYAEDGGSPPLRANLTVMVEVLEVNDFAPQINIPATVGMFETNGTMVSVPFRQINITDGDGGLAGNVTLTVSSSGGLFAAQPYRHGLYYTRALDYESVTVRSWTITLTATDRGLPLKFSSRTMTINLLDWNEYAPVFASPQYIGGVDLSTTTPEGTALVQVSATDADGLYNTVRYAISSGQSNREFTVNPVTGVIANGGFSIVETKNFSLTVTATDNGIPFNRTSSVNVTIRVLRSENVHDPVFVKALFNISINETTPIGSEILQVNATDRDNNEAGIVHYVQQSGLAEFSVDQNTGVVKTKVNFDYDNGPRVYYIIVQARDKGIFRPRTSPIPASIEVHILNNNDHAPQFLLAPYSGRVDENDPVNYTLPAKVLATDSDGAGHPTGTVRYSIARSAGSDDFAISAVTGELSIARSLDYEQQKTYSLTIVAKDGATPPLNATATYTITVGDVNDNFPMFYAPVDTSVVLNEEEPAGYQLTTVFANDTDTGFNGQVTYEVDPKLFALFAVGATSGKVTTATQIDRETSAGCYNVTITASDAGSPPLKTSIYIGVTVTDVNDVGPRFAQSSYSAPVLETLPDGALVAQVSATDGDVDAINQVITYIIVGGTGKDLFRVNASSGEIFKQRVLDFESVKNYTVLVNATNGPFHDQTIIVVRVTDANDNPPYFSQSLYNVSVEEESLSGKSVAQLRVIDVDTLKDDIGVSYSVVSTGMPFAVGRTTGLVTVSGRLDYDSHPTPYSVVIACHPLNNMTTTYNTTIVRVTLLPINDNTPIFSSGFISKSILENEPAQPIATLIAIDRDLPKQEILYQIVLASSAGVASTTVRDSFTINNKTGVVSTTGPLDREVFTDKAYLTVSATDNGVPAKTGTAFLQITVGDVVDVAPKFTQPVYYFTVSENSGRIQIGTLSTTDPDTGDTTTFTIPDPTAGVYFSIGKFNGRISLDGTLDRQMQDRWVFNVTATDSRNLVSTALVNISVADFNDQYPIFTNPSTYVVSVTETSSVSVPIGIQVSATDNDIGDNAQFRFSITGGIGASDFHVNNVTGVMTVAHSLDREHQAAYFIRVTATDLGIPPLNTSTYVNITILDVNDNAPRMDQDIYYGYIDENSALGTPVAAAPDVNLTVSASDSDQQGNDNSRLRYKLDGPQRLFSVDDISGLIYVSGSLDREADPAPYILHVRARDLNGTGLTSDPSVINITIVDTDDSAPVFSQPFYTGTVIESAANGTSVLQVINNFSLTVTATDNGIPFNRTSITAATIQVLRTCSSEETTSAHGAFLWPETILWDAATLPCPIVLVNQPQQFATRRCEGSNGLGSSRVAATVWAGVDSSQCPSPITQALQTLALVSYNDSGPAALVSAGGSLDNLTRNASDLSKDSIQLASVVISKLVDVIYTAQLNSTVQRTVSLSIINTTSNVQNAMPERIDDTIANRLTTSVEKLTASLALDEGENFTVVKDNIGVAVLCQRNISSSGLHVTVRNGNDVFLIAPTIASTEDPVLSFTVPKETIHQATEATASTNSTPTCPVALTQFTVYREAVLFQDPRLPNNTMVASRIVSAQVGSSPLRNLSPPATMQFNLTSSEYEVTNVTCASWNYSLNGWSPDGCQIVRYADNTAVCQCDHMTHFAVLVSHNFQKKKSPPNSAELALIIISYVGLGLSMIGLIATLVTILVLKKLRGMVHQQLMFGLCSTLLIVSVLFVSAIQATSNHSACTAVAVILHYLLLCSFMWMSIDATLLYRQIVVVLGSQHRMNIKSAAGLVTGIPLVIVAAAAGATRLKAYGNTRDIDYCWINNFSVFYGAFIAPVAVSLIYNFTILVMVLRSLQGGKKQIATAHNKKQSSLKYLLRVAVSLSVLLGITWVFGLLAVLVDHIAVHFIFAALNTLQGFVIFLHTIRAKDVRRGWSEALGTMRSTVPSSQHHAARAGTGGVATLPNTNESTDPQTMSFAKKMVSLGSKSSSSPSPVTDNRASIATTNLGECPDLKVNAKGKLIGRSQRPSSGNNLLSNSTGNGGAVVASNLSHSCWNESETHGNGSPSEAPDFLLFQNDDGIY